MDSRNPLQRGVSHSLMSQQWIDIRSQLILLKKSQVPGANNALKDFEEILGLRKVANRSGLLAALYACPPASAVHMSHTFIQASR